MNGHCTIDGTVAQLIFQNPDNGYTVLRMVTADGEAVTVVGAIPCAAPGENLIVTGSWVSHPVHGDQIQAQQVERHMPSTEDEILAYLSSGVIKGIGPGLADRLVQRYGVRTLEVMEERGLIDLNRRTDRIQITLRQVEHKVDLEASGIIRRLRRILENDL